MLFQKQKKLNKNNTNLLTLKKKKKSKYRGTIHSKIGAILNFL